ncbi:endo alpha-1,4 polygalactosaminidase [Neptunomonas sp. XY-337]|uniref:endo alpha-1,4 polygalactosaminidase n=1 Tax=Neptunomonas sp. XY-337 TaxID=2561897 RepID=UPI0010AA2746|nr:endo alpha-1,4 polygalactosaminidase [Neptunomonas sp. XY-337]
MLRLPKSLTPLLLTVCTTSLILTGCGGGGGGSESTAVVKTWYQPSVNTSWHWQLLGDINTEYPVELYDVDLFNTSSEQIAALQVAGKKVICYFSAGSHEAWREDAALFPEAAIGSALPEWDRERWLDIRSSEVHQLMLARLDLAKSKGCDGVEPDNTDAYLNDPGFPISRADQIEYHRFLAEQAHARDLAIGLKNNSENAAQLVDLFDFTVNEQCFEYNECEALSVFIAQGKPVFNAEYSAKYKQNPTERNLLCASANALQFQTLILPLELNDSYRDSCTL